MAALEIIGNWILHINDYKTGSSYMLIIQVIYLGAVVKSTMEHSVGKLALLTAHNLGS